MRPTITFRGMESSPTIEQYIQERIKKIDRILDREPSPKNLEVVLVANPVHHHHEIEARLHSANYHVRAHVEGSDLYERIDRVFDVLVGEIRKQKDKWLSKRNRPHDPKVSFEE